MVPQEEAARFFQALGDPTRLALIEELRKGERNVNDLVRALGCPQPKVSRHLKVLKDAGVVRDERSGRHVAYTLTTERHWPKAARAWVERLLEGLPLAAPSPRPTPRPVANEAPPADRAVAAPKPKPNPPLDAHLL